MGGAERADRKRRKDALADAPTQAIRPARPGGPPTRPPSGQVPPARRKWTGGRVAVLVALAVLAVVVVVTVVVALTGRSTPTPVAASHPVRLDGAVVVAGQPTARSTVDVFEDYLCPACALFEETYGAELTQALNDGQVQVRFIGVAILSNRSNPPGYSVRAANAAACSVDAKIFPAYHARLFADQPREGSAGKSDDELVALGRELGAQGDFEGCVRSSRFDAAIIAQTKGVTATPTVTVGGEKVDTGNPNWLREVIQRG